MDGGQIGELIYPISSKKWASPMRLWIPVANLFVIYAFKSGDCIQIDLGGVLPAQRMLAKVSLWSKMGYSDGRLCLLK